LRLIISLLILILCWPLISAVYAVNGPDMNEEMPVGSSNISWQSPGKVMLDPSTIKALQQEENAEDGQEAIKMVKAKMMSLVDYAMIKGVGGEDLMKFIEEIERIKKMMAAKREEQMQQTHKATKATYNDMTRVLDTVMNNKTLSVVKTAAEDKNFGIKLKELFDVLIQTDCWVNLTEFFRYRDKHRQAAKESKKKAAADDKDELSEYLSY
jgi:hypothetical protein